MYAISSTKCRKLAGSEGDVPRTLVDTLTPLSALAYAKDNAISVQVLTLGGARPLGVHELDVRDPTTRIETESHLPGATGSGPKHDAVVVSTGGAEPLESKISVYKGPNGRDTELILRQDCLFKMVAALTLRTGSAFRTLDELLAVPDLPDSPYVVHLVYSRESSGAYVVVYTDGQMLKLVQTMARSKRPTKRAIQSLELLDQWLCTHAETGVFEYVESGRVQKHQKTGLKPMRDLEPLSSLPPVLNVDIDVVLGSLQVKPECTLFECARRRRETSSASRIHGLETELAASRDRVAYLESLLQAFNEAQQMGYQAMSGP